MRGFTLLEILLYLALFSFTVSGAFLSIAYIHDTARVTEEKAIELLRMLNMRDMRDRGNHSF